MSAKLLRNYLRFWAKCYLYTRKPKIIGITGSVGKTSTKDAIFEVLKAAFGNNVRKSEGNLNTKYGAALAILGFKNPPIPLDGSTTLWAWLPVILKVPFRVFANTRTKYLVLEIAADQPGDIKFLSSFIRPNASVITNFGPAHLEIFGSIEKIVEEKSMLVKNLTSGGWAVLNIDDEESQKLIGKLSAVVKTIGINGRADFMASNIVTNISASQPKTTFKINSKDSEIVVRLNSFGEVGNVYAALFAVAVSDLLKIPQDKITQGLEKVKNEKHRMEVLEGKNESIIIDDAYNANPLSMKAALKVLKKMSGKKIAVLGGMLELGDISEEVHRKIGEIAAVSCDEVISIGDLGKLYKEARNFPTKEEAVAYLLGTIQKGDIILIKASRGIGLEAIVEALKK